MKARLHNIDLIKGFLIFLVIIGHIIPGKIDETFSRYFIYQFHMPLFIGISGFLFNYKSLITISFKNIFSKYWLRVFIPWIIAVIIYLPFSNIPFLSMKKVIYRFFLPYYHLWFIPSFLMWVFATVYLKKMKIKTSYIFIFSLIMSILFQFPRLNETIIFSKTGILGGILWHHSFNFFNYYFYFILGILLKENLNLKNIKINLYLIFSLYIILDSLLYFFRFCSFEFSYPLKTIFNITLLYILIYYSTNHLLPRNKLLEWTGVNSLGLYLWHMLPVFILKKVFPEGNIYIYYSTQILGQVVLFILYKYLLHYNFFRKYFFGLG
ncbi:acyltransferase family protein [Ornithobacterium rhinotracheale]|uniref:acyltransferase family protein n=1 Tax=Ornithobacterium rhinotracheale TaxID=28251 RepID=UPI00129C6877|nr:acyltransferase [Ornithobacterium rhinotracheale]MRJ09489.1 acyltransferase [Ornithobacterium rhinotracheale]